MDIVTDTTTPPTISLAILWQVWTRPRAVVRALMPLEERDERVVVFLGFLGGWLALAGLRAGFCQNQLTWAFIAFCPGPILGFLHLYLYGAVLRWTGSWLGGQATSYGIRATIVLGMIPHIAYGLLWLPVLLGLLPVLTPSESAEAVVTFFRLLEAVVILWGFVILLKSLSEVNQFSVGQALIACVLSYLVMVGPFLACGLIGAVAQLLAQPSTFSR